MGFIQKDIQELIKDIALKNNLSVKSVTDIVESEFDFVASEMRKGEIGQEDSFSTILLKYLGTFKFTKSKYKSIEKLIKKRDEKRARELQS